MIINIPTNIDHINLIIFALAVIMIEIASAHHTIIVLGLL